jgi:hypothetical protein
MSRRKSRGITKYRETHEIADLLGQGKSLTDAMRQVLTAQDSSQPGTSDVLDDLTVSYPQLMREVTRTSNVTQDDLTVSYPELMRVAKTMVGSSPEEEKSLPCLLNTIEWSPKVDAHQYVPLAYLEQFLLEFPVDTDPPYQRGIVWSESNQSDFMGYLLSRGYVPKLAMATGRDGILQPAELFDGKQRVTAALRWLGNEIPAVTPKGTRFFRSDLDPVSERKLRTGYGLEFSRYRIDRWEIPEAYIRLNFRGVPHTAADYDLAVEQMRSICGAEAVVPARGAWEKGSG